MAVRFASPLTRGDRIGVTAPSSGVPSGLRPRLEFCVACLRRRGYEVVMGECLGEAGVGSAPAVERAGELQAMLMDPSIRAIVPPWGGELLVEILLFLDFTAIGAAEPTWVVGYSDVSTLLLALTTRAGVATLHGPNLMDTPYLVPPPLRSWLDVVEAPTGATVVQAASSHHRSGGLDRWEDDPTVTEYRLDRAGRWQLLDPDVGDIDVTGRLIGGCIETVSTLAGTSFGDVNAFGRDAAPDGLIVYLEAAEAGALTIARDLWRMRLAGWFDSANAVMVGRSQAPDESGFSQLDAVRSALGDLGLPVLLDVDCGHVPPQLALVNGARARLTFTRATASISQELA